MFRTDARSAIAMVSLNVEPAVALLTYDVIVTDKVEKTPGSSLLSIR